MGLDAARARRPTARTPAELARGPARLAMALGITSRQYGVDLCSDQSPVQLERLARYRPLTWQRAARRDNRRGGSPVAVLAGRRAFGVIVSAGQPPGTNLHPAHWHLVNQQVATRET